MEWLLFAAPAGLLFATGWLIGAERADHQWIQSLAEAEAAAEGRCDCGRHVMGVYDRIRDHGTMHAPAICQPETEAL